MRKILITIALLTLPLNALAAPVSWDGNFGSQILQPLQSFWGAEIKGDHFTATGTQASAFPYASSTAFTAISGFFTDLYIGAVAIAEYIADTTGAMFSSNTETGITVTYQDADNTIDVVCATADTDTFGCLTSTDWDTFNDKQPALGFTPANQATTLTVAGTANQITSSAGAQDLSANRTWTLSLPNLVIFPSNASSTLFSSDYASTTNWFAGNGTSTNFAIPSLSSALLQSAADGSVGEYAGTSCTNQFVRSLSALGLATCATVSLTADITGTLAVGNGGTGATTLTGLLQGNGTSAITAVTGTAGQFPYFNGTNTLLASSTPFLATTGRIGIGTVSPTAKLEVQVATPGNEVVNVLTIGTTESSGGQLLAGDGTRLVFKIAEEGQETKIGAGIAALRVDANDNNTDTDLAFYVSQNDETLDEMMRILSTGNVGIGDTSPLSLFTVGSGDLFQVASNGSIQAQGGIPSSIRFSAISMRFNHLSNFPSLTNSEDVPYAYFDASTDEEMDTPSFVMPDTYSSNMTLKARAKFVMASATSGNVVCDFQIKAVANGQSVASETFDSVNADTEAVPGTAGQDDTCEATLTNNDSVAAGEKVILRFRRDANNASDTATGDMKVSEIELYWD